MCWDHFQQLIFPLLSHRSTSSYRLKHRVKLEDVWLHNFQDGIEHEEETEEDAGLGVTLAVAWGLTFCLVCFG